MSGAIPPLPEYAFMAWFSVKAQGQLYLHFTVWGNIKHSTNGDYKLYVFTSAQNKTEFDFFLGDLLAESLHSSIVADAEWGSVRQNGHCVAM
jgi:hypothetical protein